METAGIRLIAIDCDGTLFSRHGTLSKYSAGVLREMREKNIKAVICSGRPFYSISRAIDRDLFDYAVCVNGHSVVRNDGTVLFQARFFSKDETKRITALVEKHRVMLAASYDDTFHYFCSKRRHFIIRSVQLLKNVARFILRRNLWHDDLISDYEKLCDHDMEKFCFSGTRKELEKIRDVLKDAYYCTFVGPFWLEIMPPGINKGTGLEKAMADAGAEPAECAAIGDGENDLPMFSAVGIPVAMANASESVKAEACMITEYNYDRDGAARWISDHVLNNSPD